MIVKLNLDKQTLVLSKPALITRLLNRSLHCLHYVELFDTPFPVINKQKVDT